MFKDKFNIRRATPVAQDTNVNVIPTEIKKRLVSMHLAPEDLLIFDKFSNKINAYFISPSRYSVLVRVSYTNKIRALEWKSLGNQIGLVEINGKYPVYDLHDAIIVKLRDSQDIYDYTDGDIVSFQLLINYVVYTDIVVSKNLFKVKSLGDSKDLINVSKTVKGFNQRLPLTYDSQYFGSPLSAYIENNKVVGFISRDGYDINFVNIINKHIFDESKKIECFTNNTQFYYKSDNDKPYIIIVEPSELSQSISIYTTGGINILNVADYKLKKDTFSRKIGNVLAYIDSNGIFKKDILLNLEPVKPKVVKGLLATSRVPDWMVGSIDLETYQESIDEAKLYAMGYYTRNNMEIFYIDKTLNSDQVAISCLDSLLTEKFHMYTFYIHNLGKFDGIFLLRILVRLRKNYPDIWDYNTDFKDNKILYLDISKKVGKKKYRIKIHDSLLMLNASLDELCKTFDTNIKKGIFPYNFVKRDTLFYIGVKPDYGFYNNVKKEEYNNIPFVNNVKPDYNSYNNITREEYNNIPSVSCWSVENETIKYLKDDLISLYQVIDKFKYQVFIDYHTHITKSLTISGLALNIFLNKFYNNNIPLINKKSIYNDIKESYYGGITEVYKPYGEDLNFYDVNSLYPYCGLNPLPGLKCVYIDNINKDISDCKNFFGFYKCIIDAPDNYLGYLPVRSKEGIIMPTGSITGWYFSEELKFAHEQGCKIQVISGYKFNKEYNVFKEYIDRFYKIKSTTGSSVTRMVAKSLLNNLIGRFGLNIDKTVTRLISYQEYQEILQYKQVHNVVFIDDEVLVTHSKDVSIQICEEHNVDYNQALINDIKYAKHSNISERQYNAVSIAIASAVTAYARIYMQKVKLNILKNGGSLFYTDTDSIITDIELDKSNVGPDIGQFKLVDKIKEGYFITSKTYGFLNLEGRINIIAKGLNDKNLEPNKSNISEKDKNLFKYDDLIKLYNEDNVETIRKISHKNYSSGFVTIDDKSPITLYGDSYLKRVKLYDNNNLWINTKPIYRKYHTNTEDISKYKMDIFAIILTIFLFVIIIYFKLININIIEVLLGDILETVNDNMFSDSVDISSYNTNSNSIKSKLDFYKYGYTQSDFYKYNNIYNNADCINNAQPGTNKFKILRAIINKHSDQNISDIQSELIYMKLKVLSYENLISEYKNFNYTMLEDINRMQDIISKK